MNNEEDKSGDEAIESNKQVLTLTLDELKRSHSILENVMAWLPVDTRKEFVELLLSLPDMASPRNPSILFGKRRCSSSPKPARRITSTRKLPISLNEG